MQLDVEVSPPAFVRVHPELECTCSVTEVYMQCRLNVCSQVDRKCRKSAHFYSTSLMDLMY